MTPDQDHDLTIDELSRESGMTVRNIRAHQARGLLPPPEVRARTGFYGPEHVARLGLIQDMQADGLNLKAIERMVQAGGVDGLFSFGRAARDAFVEEEPELTTGAEIAERLGVERLSGKQLAKSERLGLIRALGDDRYEVPSPTLLRSGEELVALGVPLDHVLSLAGTVQRHTRSIAAAFVRLFVDEILGGEHHVDPAAWPRSQEALERLQPLAAQAVRASFHQTISDEVDRELEKRMR